MTNRENESGLIQAAGTAQALHGAIKTGKAIASAAKGVAGGGLYGAVAGLALGLAQDSQKFLAAAMALLTLPILFILLLPSLVFAGLSVSGTAGQPILNDNTAIVQNVNDISFAVN